eukprot:scaffold9041_cov171-Cylindrotheca_fusiformis.AAC.3
MRKIHDISVRALLILVQASFLAKHWGISMSLISGKKSCLPGANVSPAECFGCRKSNTSPSSLQFHLRRNHMSTIVRRAG